MPLEILLINCYAEEKEAKIEPYRQVLRRAAPNLGMGVSFRVEGDDALSGRPFDLAVVSGSKKMVGEGECEPGLLEWMRSCDRPLLGICYGHQALAHAFGGTVRLDAREHRGDEEVRFLESRGLFEGFPAVSPMRESHKEVVVRNDALRAIFEETAESPDGGLEGIRHRERPLFGVQFHPERSEAYGPRLFLNFLRMAR